MFDKDKEKKIEQELKQVEKLLSFAKALPLAEKDKKIIGQFDGLFKKFKKEMDRHDKAMKEIENEVGKMEKIIKNIKK